MYGRLAGVSTDGWWFRMTARLMFHMTCVPHRGSLPATPMSEVRSKET